MKRWMRAEIAKSIGVVCIPATLCIFACFAAGKSVGICIAGQFRQLDPIWLPPNTTGMATCHVIRGSCLPKTMAAHTRCRCSKMKRWMRAEITKGIGVVCIPSTLCIFACFAASKSVGIYIGG